MRRFTVISAALLAVSLLSPVRGGQDPIQVAFTPQEDVQGIWVKAIDGAQQRIEVSCFGISNRAVVDALERALGRGIKVLVCEDNRQSHIKTDMHGELETKGAVVVIKKAVVLEHDKMIAVDGKNGIIGSWNLSKSASAQDNSIVYMDNQPQLVSKIENTILKIYDRDKLPTTPAFTVQ